MKRVLITGATGFIGRHCLSELSNRGYEVHAVFSRKPESDLPCECWHQADLLDFEQIPALVAKVQPSHLLHLAWFTAPGRYWTSPENLRWIQSSLSLLQTFVRHGGSRVVMAGTCAEYDWRYGFCSESLTPLNPASLYGVCKLSLGRMLASFASEAELSAAWGRIFFVYGPYEHPDRLVPSVIRALLRGRLAECSSADEIRDFLYVEDAAQAIVALLDCNVKGSVNIASGIPVSLKMLVLQIGEQLGRRNLIRLGTASASSRDSSMLVADVRRLTYEVGWLPSHDLTAGLDRTIEWWKARISSELAEPWE